MYDHTRYGINVKETSQENNHSIWKLIRIVVTLANKAVKQQKQFKLVKQKQPGQCLWSIAMFIGMVTKYCIV